MGENLIKLFIHIGQPKTGTSAIQSFLNYNREHLANNHSVLYPNLKSVDFAMGLQHNHAPFFMNAKVNNKIDECLETLNNCHKYCLNNGIDKIVLSNEGFFWHWWPEIIKRATLLMDVDYKIVLYLRRQDKYLESAWKQWGHKLDNCNSIQDYSKIANLDWFISLAPWLKAFEPNNFIVQAYEKSVIGDDIITNFMSLLGIDDMSEFITPPETNENINTGFNRDIIEILKLSKSLVKDQNDHSLLEFLFNMLSPAYQKNMTENYGFLSPRESLDIIEYYKRSNKMVANTFYGVNNKGLFNDPLPNENDDWEPFSGLTIEKVVPIFMEILLKQSQEIQDLKNKK